MNPRNAAIQGIVALFVLACLFVVTSARASVITPSSATASSTIDTGRTADKLIDGSGLSGVGDILTQTHGLTGNNTDYWLSGGVTNNTLTFTLPSAFDIDSAYIWQYDRDHSSWNDRGIQTFDISFSTDNGTTYPTTISGMSLNRGAETGVEAVQTVNFVSQSSVTNVQFSNTVNFGDASYTGLAEVRFGEFVPPPPPPPGTVLNSVADTWVKGGDTTDNSSNDLMHVKNENDSSQNARKAYMRFDLASLGFDPATDMDTAMLQLDFIESGAGAGGDSSDWTFAVFGLNDADVGESWDDNAITWDNAPANNTGSGSDMLTNATSLGEFTLTGHTGAIDFTGTNGTAVGDFVRQSLSDDFVTFVVTRITSQADAGGANYVHAIASLENATELLRPALVLSQTELVPEPSSCLIWTIGLLGLGWYRWRRRSARSR